MKLKCGIYVFIRRSFTEWRRNICITIGPLNSQGDIASLRRSAVDDSSYRCRAQTQSLHPQSGFHCMIHRSLRQSKTEKTNRQLLSGGITCTYRSSKADSALFVSRRLQPVGRLPPALCAFCARFYFCCSPCLI